MTEEEKMTKIWITWDTYRKLLQVKGALKLKNPDETINELVEFWKKHQM